MNLDLVRKFCMSMPHATENVQWGDHLCFKIAGGRLFCIMSLEPGEIVCSFKCTPEKFVELQETEGIIPAPYMARAHWVALERFDVLRDAEFRELLATSYKLNYEKLTLKFRAQLEGTAAKKSKAARRPSRTHKTAKSGTKK
jgi:predicted DNA-binding protein (MmcQ/YjbR family)